MTPQKIKCLQLLYIVQTKFHSHEILGSYDKKLSTPFKALKVVHSLTDVNDMIDVSTISVLYIVFFHLRAHPHHRRYKSNFKVLPVCRRM